MRITFLEYVLLLAIGFMLGALYQSAQYAKQPKRYIDTIIVHHSGAKNIDISAKEMKADHINEKGWKDIAYHYVIRRNGDLEIGRDLSKIGSHAFGRNKTSIGICLSGNTATSKQIKTLYKLCKRLAKLCPYLKKIERHNEECPGLSVDVEKLEQDIIGGRK